MISQIEQLTNFIKSKGQVSYDEVIAEAYNICPHWRSETITRGLRKQTDIKAIGKLHFSPVGSHNPIIAYKAVNQLKTPPQAISGQIKRSKGKYEKLNNQLREILRNIQPYWENFNEIDRIQKAIKEVGDYNKRVIIRKYATN